LGTRLAREQGKLFIMNDRADLAVAADTEETTEEGPEPGLTPAEA
jgi:hypothetical protein